ncbi:MAG TPA: hypothetical protein DDZ89_05680 [Clostridiales bacterium]|nr:hypothetical protein [Clostridiales bacterium]
MQILSYVDEPIKISIRIKKDKKTGVKTVEYVIHGPNKVPEWHRLYDRNDFFHLLSPPSYKNKPSDQTELIGAIKTVSIDHSSLDSFPFYGGIL